MDLDLPVDLWIYGSATFPAVRTSLRVSNVPRAQPAHTAPPLDHHPGMARTRPRDYIPPPGPPPVVYDPSTIRTFGQSGYTANEIIQNARELRKQRELGDVLDKLNSTQAQLASEQASARHLCKCTSLS